jgi:hypothetical protein
MAALVQDLAAATASNWVGPGTITSGILGATSLGTEAIADFTDPNVSIGSAFGNLGINTGLLLLGLVPDAKFVTTGVKGAKFLARIAKTVGTGALLMGLGNLGVEGKQALERIINDVNSGKGVNLTKDDVVLLGRALSTLIQGRAAYANSKAIK